MFAKYEQMVCFQWFVDFRASLKARCSLCKLKICVTIGCHNIRIRLKKSNWSSKINGSKARDKSMGFLSKPYKRYSISRDECIIRIEDYLKIIWSLRRYFIKTFGRDPSIIDGEQMPLHRNESIDQATLIFKSNETCQRKPFFILRASQHSQY